VKSERDGGGTFSASRCRLFATALYVAIDTPLAAAATAKGTLRRWLLAEAFAPRPARPASSDFPRDGRFPSACAVFLSWPSWPSEAICLTSSTTPKRPRGSDTWRDRRRRGRRTSCYPSLNCLHGASPRRRRRRRRRLRRRRLRGQPNGGELSLGPSLCTLCETERGLSPPAPQSRPEIELGGGLGFLRSSFAPGPTCDPFLSHPLPLPRFYFRLRGRNEPRRLPRALPWLPHYRRGPRGDSLTPAGRSERE